MDTPPHTHSIHHVPLLRHSVPAPSGHTCPTRECSGPRAPDGRFHRGHAGSAEGREGKHVCPSHRCVSGITHQMPVPGRDTSKCFTRAYRAQALPSPAEAAPAQRSARPLCGCDGPEGPAGARNPPDVQLVPQPPGLPVRSVPSQRLHDRDAREDEPAWAEGRHAAGVADRGRGDAPPGTWIIECGGVTGTGVRTAGGAGGARSRRAGVRLRVESEAPAGGGGPRVSGKTTGPWCAALGTREYGEGGAGTP